MKSIWYEFIDNYEEQMPYKPISVILEAFYWYCQMTDTNEEAYRNSCYMNVQKLMMK